MKKFKGLLCGIVALVLAIVSPLVASSTVFAAGETLVIPVTITNSTGP